MFDSIGALVKIQQDYSQRPVSQENTSLNEANIIEAAATLNEDLLLDNQGEPEQFNKEKTQQAVDKLNQTMETYNTELRFQLHEKSGEYMVKIVNTKDDSVIRELPPEKVLNMVAYFKEVLGLVVDKFA